MCAWERTTVHGSLTSSAVQSASGQLVSALVQNTSSQGPALYVSFAHYSTSAVQFCVMNFAPREHSRKDSVSVPRFLTAQRRPGNIMAGQKSLRLSLLLKRTSREIRKSHTGSLFGPVRQQKMLKVREFTENLTFRRFLIVITPVSD